mmetsp:Transcript_7878/g.19557  ORF Transcript_7878/g.19557 Transcript_7878/m.19557 type:complete len:210 (-) Transcript_7878:3041-3670(-)
MKLPVLCFVFTTVAQAIGAFGFTTPVHTVAVPPAVRTGSFRRDRSQPHLPLRAETAAKDAAPTKDDSDPNRDAIAALTPSGTRVYELLKDLHDSGFAFRIIVVADGAILESTNVLGPVFNLSLSKKTGLPITTFASADKSFEFHLKLAEVASAVLVEKPSRAKEGRTMRLLRFSKESGKICTLILKDDDDVTAAWFRSMVEKHGSEIEF